ncbi:phage tail protein [Bacillus cereus]|nr:phage tail spike protein [Bacillus cereus]EEL77680.1 Phage minor structural protein [Bacillus cereus AH676]KMP41376.1 phage minor structural protein [Bacillus cereus]MDZ4471995.1 phage tail protein [Bacillus cereus]MEB9883248.1 phage tail spike protein [Bacillus cereus]HDR4450745.1 phage tail protein [Bacillus cereus]
MLKLYNKQLQLKAYLENAYKIKYNPPLNEVWTAGFSLPFTDLKREEIETFDYVEIFDNEKRIGMFRIMDSKENRDADEKIITYECEHVLSTLLDGVLFGYHQLSNYTTKDVIEYLLSKQRIKHWKMGECEFIRYFHYAWENENTLLGPLLSIPKPFDERYQWTWDDSSYPWTLNLVRITDEVTAELRYRKNMKGIKRYTDPTNVMTRIYPYGYGEGVNQLTIKDVNNGVPYIDAPGFIRDLYDGFDYIWVDKRFQDAQSLYDSARSLLIKRCTPKVSYEIDVIDYELIDPYKIEKFETGKLVRLFDEDLDIWVDLRVMDRPKGDVTGNPLDVKLKLENKVADLGTTQADIEKRQQINELYSQGATNIDSHDYNDNCDPENPAVMRFYLPDDLVNINSLILTYFIEEFRAYSKATKGGGATVQSTGGGGAIVASTGAGGGTIQSTGGGGATIASSSAGGGVSKSTESGGGSSQTSSAGGGISTTSEHKTFLELSIMSGVPENSIGSENWGNHLHEIKIPGDYFSHSHAINLPNHVHAVLIPSHSHSFQTPNHVHQITLNDHVHQIVLNDHVHQIELKDHIHEIILPDHFHDILHGIFKLSEKPSKVLIKVDGNIVPVESVSADNINLIPYLSKDSGGKVERGKWHTIEIFPDKLGRVNANIISRLFIQSRVGGTF